VNNSFLTSVATLPKPENTPKQKNRVEADDGLSVPLPFSFDIILMHRN